MHLVVFPHALINAPITPFISTFPFDIVLNKLASIFVPISPGELTEALLHALLIETFKAAAIRPALYPSTILRVVEPEATVE